MPPRLFHGRYRLAKVERSQIYIRSTRQAINVSQFYLETNLRCGSANAWRLLLGGFLRSNRSSLP